MVAAVQARFPGHRFRRVSGIDDQHGELRFAWELTAPDGSIVVGSSPKKPVTLEPTIRSEPADVDTR
jgi:hypothetical protein